VRGARGARGDGFGVGAVVASERVPTDAPREGCIVLLDRGAGSGHVGFYVKSSATEIRLLGGNQSDMVCESS